MENEKHPTQQENKCYPNMPAFASEHSFGLTKREYFAAMAMQGFIHEKEYLFNENIFFMVTTSVRIADELIKKLNQ